MAEKKGINIFDIHLQLPQRDFLVSAALGVVGLILATLLTPTKKAKSRQAE